MTTEQWGSPQEVETKKRIKIAIYAYAYELKNDPLIDDAEYDRLAREIDLTIDTGKEIEDKFFKEHYDASTGMWIHQHPNLAGISRIYNRFYHKDCNAMVAKAGQASIKKVNEWKREAKELLKQQNKC